MLLSLPNCVNQSIVLEIKLCVGNRSCNDNFPLFRMQEAVFVYRL